MQFLTKASLNGLGVAGKGVDRFAALERRRLEYVGRASLETGMGQDSNAELTFREQLMAKLRQLEIAEGSVEELFPGTQQPTPLPVVPNEAYTEYYVPPSEQLETPGQSVLDLPPTYPEGQVPGQQYPQGVPFRAGAFGEKLKAVIKAYPNESIAIAIAGVIAGFMILSVLKGGID